MKLLNYTIRLLLGSNDHPNKAPLPVAFTRKGVGMGRIKALLLEIIPSGIRMENDTGPTAFLPTEDIVIPTGSKESVAADHPGWLTQTPNATIIYTENSRDEQSCAAGWYVGTSNNVSLTTTYRGSCNIGPHEDIFGAEVHAIMEGIAWVSTQQPGPGLSTCA